MAGPAVRDIDLYRGDDYTHQILFVDDSDTPVPMDLSAYTFKAQIRDRPEGSTGILATFSIDTSRAAEGIITLSLPSASTRIKNGFWDLEVDLGSSKQTWLKGSVTMSGDVTKDVIS